MDLEAFAEIFSRGRPVSRRMNATTPSQKTVDQILDNNNGKEIMSFSVAKRVESSDMSDNNEEGAIGIKCGRSLGTSDEKGEQDKGMEREYTLAAVQTIQQLSKKNIKL